MSSGIAIEAQVADSYEAMKLRKSLAYAVFAINADATQITLESACTSKQAAELGAEGTYAQMVASMPKDVGRYIVYDLEYSLELEGTRNKLIFIAW